MEERYSRLEITPKIIDFGTRVVQMKLVASAGVGNIHPFRSLGKFLLVLAVLAFIGSLNSAMSLRLFSTGAETGMYLVCSVILLVAAIVAVLFTRHLLVIQLADGDRIILAAAKMEFLRTIVDHIREAMLAPTDAAIHYSVNITAQTIETQSLVDMSNTSVSHSPGAAVVAGHAHGSVGTHVNGHAAANGVARHGVGAHGHGLSVARAHRNGIAYPLPHNGPHGGAEPPVAGPAPSPNVAHWPAVAVHGSPGGVAIGTAIGSTVQSHVSVGQDLEHMIGLIERARVPDQGRVVEYLRLLQQLADAGPARAQEARATWLTFFDYAAKALAGVDGFLAVAERVHRWFMARA